MSLVTVLALQVVLMVGSALGMGVSRYLAAIIGLMCLGVPGLLPEGTHETVVVVTTAMAALPLLKTQWHWNDTPPLLFRLHQWATPFDVGQVQREPASLKRHMVRTVCFGSLLAGSWLGVDALVVDRRLMTLPPATLALVCVLGATLVYSLLELAEAVVGFVYGVAGYTIPPVQRDPILSRSISEFWGRRWNRPVSEFLSRCYFRPAVKRGSPRLGLAAAFVISALLHVYLVLFCADPWKVALMGLFFLAQVPLVFAERRLRLHRRPRWLQHGWTVGSLLLTCPLFVIPILQPLGFP